MTRDYPKYHATVKVDVHDADCYGRIKAKRLSQLVSDVATLHTRELHVDRDTMLKDGITWMLHDINVKIENMPLAGDVLEIDTFPAGIERLFALRCYEMKDGEGRLKARITSRWMQIDALRRRPIRPTQAIVELNEGLGVPEGFVMGALGPKNMEEDMVEVRRYVATYDNIDFNGHVTQASYMMWMTDSLTFDFYQNHVMREAEVVYEHEVMPETEIVALVKVEERDGKTIVWHKLTSADGTIEHCLGRTVWNSK